MKVFYVRNCRYCPSGSIIVDAVRCKMENRIVYNASEKGIPGWCPLPDAPQQKDSPDFLDQCSWCGMTNEMHKNDCPVILRK